MKRIQILALSLIVAVLMLPATATLAQETSNAAEPAEEPDRNAGEAAAAAGAEIEEGEEEEGRRRRMPSETKISLSDDQSIRITWTKWPIDGPDFPRLSEVATGEVMMITASSPPKLWTHANLVFGDLAIKSGNVAENYPGVYGLWLRKTDVGWNLIFNNKPDVWGTMYDPSADAGEVPLEHALTDVPGKAFAVELKEGTEGSGVLHLTWGEHHWSTPFTYGG